MGTETSTTLILDPMEAPVTGTDGWDEPRLAPPAESGIHVIDAEAKKLYAAAIGKPLRGRGPAPKMVSGVPSPMWPCTPI